MTMMMVMMIIMIYIIILAAPGRSALASKTHHVWENISLSTGHTAVLPSFKYWCHPPKACHQRKCVKVQKWLWAG